MLKEIMSWLYAILIALVIVILVRGFIVTPSVVKGNSMQPNLYDGDRIIISKLSSINRFDEIAFVAPNGEDNYVKRVIGLPGDEIEIINDTLYINGIAYDEDYLTDIQTDEVLVRYFSSAKVPADTYFVMGDNRKYSYDSREFGVINKDSIIGEVIFRIWPLDSIGVVNQ